jgi:hypothetical protein
LEWLCGTTTIGGEELWKKFYTLKTTQDFTVRDDISSSFIVNLKAANKVRVGEEHDIGNLVEYLNTQTIRE